MTDHQMAKDSNLRILLNRTSLTKTRLFPIPGKGTGGTLPSLPGGGAVELCRSYARLLILLCTKGLN